VPRPRLTAAHVAALAAEIRTYIGARVKSVHQDDRHVFRIALEPRKGRIDCVIDLDPAFPHAALQAATPAPGEPSPLANTLRAHLQRAKLTDAAAVLGERVLTLVFERGGSTVSLVAELFGKQANLYLLDAASTVLATPRGEIAGRRGAAVGAVLVPTPPAPERAAAQPEEAQEGVSARILALRDDATESGGSTDRTHRVRRALRKLQRTLDKRLRALEAQAAQVDEADRLERRGELLRASFHLLRKGQARVVVPDHTQDPPVEVEIELDPTSTPGEQVQRLFQRAKKSRRAVAHATEALPDTQAALGATHELLARLENDPLPESVEAWLGGVPAFVARPVREAWDPASTITSQKGPQKRVPWRAYVSADGWEIRVGKSAKDSDLLTTREARPHDLFLHVRGVPGAHVIVPTDRGKTVPKETLLDAAELACLNSRASGAEICEVDYVECRHVRKPRGAKPGLVALARSKTLRLRRDEDRRKRLLDSPKRP
jgi:predicted ribosome quality control (RQC) complex YloA/Tae2 family protein